MAAMKMKAMKAMKKRGSSVHRDRERFKKSSKRRIEATVKRIEKEFWRSLKRSLKRIIAAEYEKTIAWLQYARQYEKTYLKKCLASEVLAEFDFCRLFPWPPVSRHIICTESYSGRSGSGGRAP